LTKQRDPIYSERCLSAASRCFDWCMKSETDNSTGNIGAAIATAIELYKVTENHEYSKIAMDYAGKLSSLQVKDFIDTDNPIRGFYLISPDNPEPYLDIWHGCWHFIALCDLIEAFPHNTDALKWKDSIASYSQGYLLPMTKRNSFGIVPYGFFSKGDPGGNRRIGKLWYRYFMRPTEGWWVGINANLASAGVGLAKASRILQDSDLLAIAQRQLDWIFGFNPHGASTVEGIGYNHPGQFINGNEFKPATPRIPGAVMNGIGGTMEDQPHLHDGSYHTAEYWTPMAAYTMWLMAELCI